MFVKERVYPSWFIEELVREEDKERARDGQLSSRDYCSFMCPECKNCYRQQVGKHINLSKGERKQGCPVCAKEKISRKRGEYELKKNRIYPSWFIGELVREEDKERAREGSLKSTEDVLFFCERCEATYLQKVKYHINLTHGKEKHKCPRCSKSRQYASRLVTIVERRPSYPSWFIEELVKEEDKERARNKTLLTSETVELRCREGHVYRSTVCSHLVLGSGKVREGCPVCARKRSKAELEIEELVKSLGLGTQHRKFYADGKSYEIDIFIPDKKIGIEYNGSYWHQTYPVEYKSKLYHQSKFSFFKSKGIQLITIFDVDWSSDKRRVYEDYLKGVLCRRDKVYARECEVTSELEQKGVLSFYEKNHLLGRPRYVDVSYGLTYRGELVACMSFQKNRYREGWCLCRFVNKRGVTVTGGASRLFSSFVRDHRPDKVISFSDNDCFTGGVYERLGFRDCGVTSSPRYYWYLDGKGLSREGCQLKILSRRYPDLYEMYKNEKGNKEDYILSALGAVKVYRSGHTKWVWERPSC